MVTREQKHCDKCRTKVAERRLLFFHTTMDYVTVRMDGRPGVFDDRRTVRDDFHYCLPCWFGILKAAREATKK